MQAFFGEARAMELGKPKRGAKKRLRKNLKKFRKSLDKGCTIWYTF